MLLLSLAIAALRLAAAVPQAGSPSEPREIVRAALAARRGDSLATVRARWDARLRANPGDRAAALGLATVARLTYDYEDAERRYRQLFAGDSARRDPYDAWARIGLGQAMEAQGLGGEPVLALYAAARDDARRAGDRTAEGTARLRAGETLGRTGRGKEGLAQFDSATAVLPPEATDVAAALRCRRSQVFIATARQGAADSLRAARAAATSSGDDEARAVCLAATAIDYWLRGKQDSVAIIDAERLAHRRRMRDWSGLSLALASHADHLTAQGDYGGATRALREAATRAHLSHNHYIEAAATLELGSIALALGDVATAREDVDRSVRAFEAIHDTSSVMMARALRPTVSLAAGDLAGARSDLTSILGFWQREQDWTQLVELYSRLVAIELRAGDLAAAQRALDAADAAGRRANAPAWLAEVGYRRGQLALARGDLATAERAFTRYLAAVDSGEHLKRYEGGVRLAEAHARRGDAAAAERELAAAGRALDSWRRTLSEPEMRTLAFQASPFQATDVNASVAVVLAALVRDGRGEAAFELAERRRARELAERLTRTRALRDTAVRDTARTATDSALGAATLGLAEVARALPDDHTALLEYATGGGGAPSALFVVTRRGGAHVAAHLLPPADSLVGEVSRLVGLLEDGDDPRPLERALGAALLDSALRGLDSSVTRLVVVPDGPLHRVPWDALRLADGRYVAERYATGTAPSATVAAMLWRRPRGAIASTRLLAFGDPAFANAAKSEEGEIYRSAFAASGGLPRLPESAREARLVARYADEAEVRLGADATADYLEHTPLGRFDVVHLATHALVDERAATRNALALAPGRSDADGFVAAADLAALDLTADLVVLSACRSAGGVVVDGEGVQGLTAPLLAAGARSVVATTWRISDRGTVPLIDAFYAGLARGLPVADALRAAKLDAIHRGVPPRDWAAFTAVGDPLVTVPLHAPRPDRRWMLAAALGLLVLGGGAAWGVARRRRGAAA